MADPMPAVQSQASIRPSPTRWLAPAVVVLATLCSALLILYLWPWTSDDAFITFRYARNLAAGHGPVFNPGEPVEGYSNFLFVLLLGLASFLSLDVVLVAKLAGVVGLAAVAILTSRLAAQLDDTPNPAKGTAPLWTPRFRWCAAIVAFLLTGTSVPLAYWAVSGMETLPYTALVLLGALQYLRYRKGKARGLGVGAVFLAAALLRAEGAVFFLATCLFHLAVTRSAKGRECESAMPVPRPHALAHPRTQVMHSRATLTPFPAAVVAFGLAYLGYLAFRLAYYGSLVPNTVIAKTGHSQQLSDGAVYLLQFLPFVAVPLYLGLTPRSRSSYLWWLCSMWTVLVVLFGGDWMPLHRFFVPILPFLYALAAAGVTRRWHRSSGSGQAGRRGALLFLLGFGVALNLALPLWSVRPEAIENQLSWDEATRQAGLWLAARADPRDVVAVVDAGRVPFYSGLRAIDSAGLLNPVVARLPGRFELKQGAAAHVLSWRPRYVELNAYGHVREDSFIPTEPLEIFSDPTFKSDYRLAFFQDAWMTNPGVRFVLLYERTGGK